MAPAGKSEYQVVPDAPTWILHRTRVYEAQTNAQTHTHTDTQTRTHTREESLLHTLLLLLLLPSHLLLCPCRRREGWILRVNYPR